MHEYVDDHELVTLRHDRETGLSAVIAIHDTTLGPAAGGVISIAHEFLGRSDRTWVSSRINAIADRLEYIYAEAERSGSSTDLVAENMARTVLEKGPDRPSQVRPA